MANIGHIQLKPKTPAHISTMMQNRIRMRLFASVCFRLHNFLSVENDLFSSFFIILICKFHVIKTSSTATTEIRQKGEKTAILLPQKMYFMWNCGALESKAKTDCTKEKYFYSKYTIWNHISCAYVQWNPKITFKRVFSWLTQEEKPKGKKILSEVVSLAKEEITYSQFNSRLTKCSIQMEEQMFSLFDDSICVIVWCVMSHVCIQRLPNSFTSTNEIFRFQAQNRLTNSMHLLRIFLKLDW